MLDLFSGIGGFALAAEWRWADELDIVGFCEIEKYAQKVLKKNFPGVPIIEDVRDIYRFTDEYRDIYGDREIMWCDRHDKDFADCACIGCSQWDDEFGYVDIITGGFPCVDITSAKNAIEKPKGIDGKESGLWNEFARIISILRPEWVIVENSSNLNLRGLDRIITDFTEMRYDSIWFTLSASRLGASHRRRRTFVVSNSNSQRLERNVCKELANSFQRRQYTDSARSTWWSTEPSIRRVAHGIPKRVDRLKGLGNAIVPQVAALIMERIKNA